jgi:hypothetical protein
MLLIPFVSHVASQRVWGLDNQKETTPLHVQEHGFEKADRSAAKKTDWNEMYSIYLTHGMDVPPGRWLKWATQNKTHSYLSDACDGRRRTCCRCRQMGIGFRV